MSMLSLMGHIAQQKFSALTTRQVKPTRTATPLGLHQGSAADAPILAITMARLDGAILTMPKEKMSVVSVGVTTVAGYPVFRSYLSDGVSFFQIVADPHDRTKALEVKFFSIHSETVPDGVQMGGLLGTPGRKDSEGNVVVSAEDPLIGWPQFQLDGPPPVLYERTWKAGTTPVDPEIHEESIYSADGTVTTIRHRAMEYGRTLGSGSTVTSEFLLATVIESKSPAGDDEAAFDVFLGVDVVISDLKVLAAA